jgi:N-acetylglucosamine kinase-like BadF-type ATPase
MAKTAGKALVVGVDAGGTATRAVLADLTGAVLGVGVAGPGNPVAVGRDAPLALAAALRQALAGRAGRVGIGGVDPGRVVAGVVSLAGVSRLADPEAAGAFADVWAASGLDCPMWTCGDAVAAFAAGSAAPSGAVLISGTGAVGALVEGRRIVRVADGLGWLLGDEGSGFWIGLRAVRMAVRAWAAGPGDRSAGRSDPDAGWRVERNGPGRRGGLVDLVAGYAEVGDADQLIAWATDLPRAAIAGLAPVVCAAARDGDPAAAGIAADAVRRLVGTLGELRVPDGVPVVLAGGVLAHDNPVRDGVLKVLRTRKVTVGTGRDPARGAAWLAASGLEGVDPGQLHAALCD